MRNYTWIAALLLLGCGESSSTPDAQSIDAMTAPDFDASNIDAGIDAFNPCPGQSTLELGVVDWETNENLFDIAVQVEGGNSATSAPNGRVVICIPQSGPIVYTLTHQDYLPRVHTTTAEHITTQTSNGIAPTFRLINQQTRTSLYNGTKTIIDDLKSTVIVMTDNTDGAPRSGVSVGIGNTFGRAFTPGSTPLELISGNESVVDGRVLFLNSETTPAQSTLAIKSPVGCTAPATFTIAAGISSVSAICPL